MALGIKTKVGAEKGDLLLANGNGIELRVDATETSIIYDTLFKGDELGFFTGKTKKDTISGIIYNEVVSINSLNADQSPNFNGTRYYFDSAMPFEIKANPKFDYSSGFNIGNILGIGGSIFTAIGDILGVAPNNQENPTNQKNNNVTVPQKPVEETWFQKNGLVAIGGVLAFAGVSGVIYYIFKKNKKSIKA